MKRENSKTDAQSPLRGGNRAHRGPEAYLAEADARKHPRKKERPKALSEAKRGKQKLRSTQTMCPVLAIRDGIIVTKDATFVKLMEIAPVNFELRSPAEQEEIISAFSAALRTMPGTVHMKVINTPSDITPFIDDLIELMYSETDSGCRELQYDQMQLIHGIARGQSVSRRFFLSFSYESEGGLSKRPDFASISESLHRSERSIAASLEGCGNTVLSTDSPDYIESVLYAVMSRNRAGTAAYATRVKQVEDMAFERYGRRARGRLPVPGRISPDRADFSVSPQYCLIDGRYVMYCYVPSDAYPVRALGGWTQTFFSGLEGVDVDMWIRREDPAKISKRLRFELKNNRIRERNTEDVSDSYDDIESALRAGFYIKSAISAGDDFCYMATLITITADTVPELKNRYREVRDHLIRNDLKMKKCYFQQEEAYLSAIPLAGCSRSIFMKSRRNITGSQLGSCYPFTAYELNDPGGIFFGVNPRYGSPVFLNIFDRSRYSNANMLILGPSGSGKTYTLLAMLLRMRQKGLQIYSIAPYKGAEFMRSCEAVGGEFVRIAPGSSQNINIMEIRRHESADVIIDGEIASSGSVLTAKIQQIERFFSIIVKDISVREAHVLDDALIETYARFGITVENASLDDPDRPGSYRRMPVLGDLYETLLEKKEPAERLTEALSRYVTGSAKSFSGPTNVDLSNRFIVLDVSEMTNEMLPVGMFIALDFVLDAARADRTQNKVIAIDEMWRLMSASSLTSEFTVEVFKIIRGYGGSAIGATQDLDDVLSDKSGAAIINNARFKFFLPMERKEAEMVAKIVDITAEEMKQMKTTRALRPGSERKMLLVAGSNHVFVSMKTSEREHDLITTNADDLARIAAARGAHAEDRNVLQDNKT